MNKSNFEVIVFDHKENKTIIKKRLTMEEAIILFAIQEVKFNKEEFIDNSPNH